MAISQRPDIETPVNYIRGDSTSKELQIQSLVQYAIP